jgi:nucleoside-diphosphate-sugar epimerase
MERIRRDRTTRIFLTGGTGFLGSHLAAEFLRKGCSLTLLVRPSSEGDPEKRVRRILDWHGVPEDLRRVRVLSGNLHRPGFGMDSEEARNLSRDIDEIVHCGSETSFAQRKSRDVENTNVGGLANLLDFAVAGRCGILQLVSTAYVAGKRRGLCREEIEPGDEFHNAYEESKWRAELMARDRCRDEGIRLNIFRPSVVCGDSRTGRSLNFNAVYHPVRAAAFLRDLYLKDIRERGGNRARIAGVRLNPDGSIHLPLRIEVEAGTGVDIVPVDHFTDAFMAIRAVAPDGGIFHIASGRHTPVADIVDFSRRFFRLTGVKAVAIGSRPAESRNALEVLFDGLVDVYRPYMRDARVFAGDNARPVLEKCGVVCPEFDFGLFSRCMAYAIEAGWGTMLFNGKARE